MRVHRLPRTLAVDDDRSVGGLLVLENGQLRFDLMRERDSKRLPPLTGRSDVEDLLDHANHFFHSSTVVVEVSHRHHRHPLRMIPLLVEVAHDRGFAVLDHVDLSNRQPPRIRRPVHESLEVILVRPAVRCPPLPPLLHDDAPFLVYVIIGTSDVEGPLSQHNEAPFQQVVGVDGHPQEVDSLVERRVRVLTGPELGADGFEEPHHLERVEHGSPSERQVLNHVRHSLLVILFVH
mmetsp:Transcript_6761/g.23767  ORF Transcript_6761/g.23767 Transcript_6761/m.23767 type:complete len:235 (+) Transcript_6761:2322-3026(+)